jgi:hypothetical protein
MERPQQVRTSVSEDVDDLAAATHAKPHAAVGKGKQRVIAAPSDVVARMEPGPALTHDDGTSRDGLTIKGLHAEALALRITTVAG